MERWTRNARRLKAEIDALALASRDPRTPWYARALVVAVVAYAVSPIDLIPDPIPVLGLLDDLILLPLGIALALRLIPAEAMVEARARVAAAPPRPVNWIAAGAIVAIWLAVIGSVGWLLWSRR